ncbi:hypothetical protein ACLD0W_12515 [Alloalcanivorax sp. C16-1]|uniref:hypothetical protein n=1 Tax=Alloalcanivorax sp. C16-1 TaxID=3390051 RepID=UPI003970AB1F
MSEQWISLYLRAADEPALTAALSAALGTYTDDEGAEHTALLTGTHQCVVRGPLSKPTGETDDDGMPIMQPVPGYHADLLVHPDHIDALAEDLGPVVIDPQPSTPQFKWARDEHGASG